MSAGIVGVQPHKTNRRTKVVLGFLDTSFHASCAIHGKQDYVN